MLYQGYKHLDERCGSYRCNPWTRNRALLVKSSICYRLQERVVSLLKPFCLTVDPHLLELRHRYRSNNPDLAPG